MNEIFFVTGGSGYVGKLLIQRLLIDVRVAKIIVLDRDDLREDLKNNPKVVFIQKNLVDDWEEQVASYKPTKVVHLAWQIRTLYGKKKLQNHWNIDGSRRVFDFVKNTPSVKTFVHFSTVASYGALPTNTFETIFTEDQPFKKTNYLYAEEKRIVEEELDKITFSDKNIFIIRPASITGQKGRERTGFGLQSALAGKIVSKDFLQNLLFKIISKVLQFMPATTGWARQFIHEDDIVNAVITMSFSNYPGLSATPSKEGEPKVRKYNLCPPARLGELNYIDAKEMASMLKKKAVYLHPQHVRVLCFFAWHLTFGKIPTSPGVWKAYAYPIVVDGTKMERDFADFKYQKDIRQAYLG